MPSLLCVVKDLAGPLFFLLGVIQGGLKFVFLPERDQVLLFDRSEDPQEDHNVVHRWSAERVRAPQGELLPWYFHQWEYLETTFLQASMHLHLDSVKPRPIPTAELNT